MSVTFKDIISASNEYAKARELRLVKITESYRVKKAIRKYEVIFEDTQGNQIIRSTEVGV